MTNGNDIPDWPDPRSPDLHAKPPWDVKLVGWLCIVWALFQALLGLALLPRGGPPHPDIKIFVLFGAIAIESELWMLLVRSAYAGLGCTAGCGLIKGRRFGYWVLAFLVLDGAMGSVRGLGHPAQTTCLSMLLSIVMGVWLLSRRHLFCPSVVGRALFPKATQGRSLFPKAQPGTPWDVKLMGWWGIVGGVLSVPMGVLIMVGVSPFRYANRGAFALFGIVRLTSGFWLGLGYLVIGTLGAAAGYGVLKRHPLGWWLVLVMLLHSVANMTAGAHFYWRNMFFWLALIVYGLAMTWLIFRARLYHPFSKVLKFHGK